jgi:hypothetical protein
MSAAKHTPGPWAFSRWDQYGDTRFYIAQADGAPYTPDYSDAATLIAETVSIERVAIQEANARLIAAAPELLEALRPFVAHNSDAETITITVRTADVTRVRAAIAKAEVQS